jgi:ankyrin repeat protein
MRSAPGAAAGQNGAELAAHRGRRDVLELLARRNGSVRWSGVYRLIAACALNDVAAAKSLATEEPDLLDALLAQGGVLLGQFAGTGNTEGVQLLLDLGVEVDARDEAGDGYFGVAKQSTALHRAAWLIRPGTVQLLLERGAAVNAIDGQGRTPLMLAVRGSVDSHWTERRSVDPICALLEAGATTRGVPFPCGWAEADELLRRHGAAAGGKLP